MAGQTTSSNFPTTSGAYQTALAGGTDAFSLKISMAVRPPVFTGISTDTGTSSSDEITTDQTLSISGTADIGATVKLYRQSVYLGSTTANGSGVWTYDYTSVSLAEGTYAFEATATSAGVTSALSSEFLVTVDRSVPTITLSAPASTTSFAPTVEVWASDQVGGLPASATVTIDGDMDNNGSFETLGVATGALMNGYAAILVPIAAVKTVKLRARVTDLAGNAAISSTSTVVVGAQTTWSATSSGVRIADPESGDSLLQMGDLTLGHALDLDKSPGTTQSGGASLVYHSASVNQKPVVTAQLQSPNNAALPATITATLTWNGSAQSPITLSTSSLAMGDVLTVAVQAASAVTTTGRYAWSLRLQGAGGVFDITVTGSTFVVARDSSPFGAGWSLAGLDRLVSIAASGGLPAGWLWTYGSGGYRFFQGTSGTLTSPAEDNGSLVINGGGTFTYTSSDGSTVNFNSSGYITSRVSADGKETISYSYDGSNRLSTYTSIDGGSATFSYTNASNTLISSIAAPGSRTWSFTTSGTDLTVITDPDSKTHNFTYSSHRVTAETMGSSLANQYHYATTGILDQMTWGSSSSPSITSLSAVWAQGLSVPVKGDAVATVTDALGNKTVAKLDASGRIIYQRAADGGVSTWSRDSAGRVTSYADPLGRTTGYTRDSLGYVTQVTLPDTNTISYAYQTAFHAMTSTTDERGKVTSFGWDSSGHRTSVTNALSQTTTYGFNATTGLLETITSPTSHTVTLGYDSYRRQNSTTDEFGGVTTLAFDTTTGEVATSTNALNQTTTYTRDSDGRVTNVLYADSNNESWTFNDSGLEASHTDKTGTVDQPTYDTYKRGLVTGASIAVGTNVSADEQTMFDSAGRAYASRDERGYWTSATLSPVGQTLAVTTADGNVSRNFFDLAGQLVQSRNPLGYATYQTFNSRGWVTQTTDNRANIWSATYDAAGNRLTATNPMSETGTWTVDDLNRFSTFTDAASNVVSQNYWTDGREKDFTDARGYVTRQDVDFTNKNTTTTRAYGTTAAQTTETDFDALHQTTTVEDGLGHTVLTNTYNSVGYLTGQADANNHSVSLTLNAEGDTTGVTDALNKTTSITLNALGEATQTTDPTSKTQTSILDAASTQVGSLDGLGNLTQNVQDQMGRTTYSIDPVAGQTQNQYDGAGRLIVLIDPDGNRWQWEYDANNNVTKETDPLGKTKVWVYDAANRCTSYTDRLARQKLYTYYANGLLHTEVWKNTGGTTVNTMTWTYNANGQPLSVNDNAGTVSWTYDELGRVATQTDVWGLVLTYTHDAANRVTQVADSKGGTKVYVWDDASRLTSVRYSDSGSQLRFDFTYSNRDQVTQIDRYTDTAGTTKVSLSQFTYDDAGRLTGITHKNGAGTTTLDSFNYQYDDAGRLTQETSTLGPTKNYTFDDAGQVTGDGTATFAWDANGNRANSGYVTSTGNRTTSDGTWTYTFDDEGNVIKKSMGTSAETWVYGYDNNNRLVHIEKRNTDAGASVLSVDYLYDALGNRVKRDYDADSAGAGASVATKMAYDGQNEWADLDSSLTIQTRRVATQAIDAYFARVSTSGNEDWYLDDIIGSVRDIVDSTNSALDHIDYSTFGDTPTETNSGNGDRFKFTSKEYEFGIQHNFWRDLQNGRWMQEDPIQFRAGDPNLHRYVGNMPPNAVDPSGEIIFLIPVAVFAAGAWLTGEVVVAHNRTGASYSELWTAAEQGNAAGLQRVADVGSGNIIFNYIPALSAQRTRYRREYGEASYHVTNIAGGIATGASLLAASLAVDAGLAGSALQREISAWATRSAALRAAAAASLTRLQDQGREVSRLIYWNIQQREHTEPGSQLWSVFTDAINRLRLEQRFVQERVELLEHELGLR